MASHQTCHRAGVAARLAVGGPDQAARQGCGAITVDRGRTAQGEGGDGIVLAGAAG